MLNLTVIKFKYWFINYISYYFFKFFNHIHSVTEFRAVSRLNVVSILTPNCSRVELCGHIQLCPANNFITIDTNFRNSDKLHVNKIRKDAEKMRRRDQDHFDNVHAKYNK